ncbi:MAG: 3-hydroxyacyl-CoA dehydrogenase [Polaromonas sp.]|nr:3-hydroxyacyl-CoA dehydrogenase [Polaromonas sp.]
MNTPLSKVALVAVAGHPVLLLDNRPQAAEAAVAALRAQLDKLAEGKMTPQAADLRLQIATQFSDLAAATLVVEAIVENLQAKEALFKDLKALVSADCLFGSNTSSISITAIGSALQHPQRMAGLHFFNPAPVMALVEVVSGESGGFRIRLCPWASIIRKAGWPGPTRSACGTSRRC